MYLSYCAAAPKLKSADINIYTINLVSLFTGTLLVQIAGTLYVSTDIKELDVNISSSYYINLNQFFASSCT